MKRILLTLSILLLLLSPAQAAPSWELTASSQTLSPGENLTVTLTVPDTAETLYTLQGTLHYDRDRFHPLTQEDLSVLYPWSELVYNDATGAFLLTGSGCDSAGPVLRIRLRALDNATPGPCQVTLDQLQSVDGSAQSLTLPTPGAAPITVAPLDTPPSTAPDPEPSTEVRPAPRPSSRPVETPAPAETETAPPAATPASSPSPTPTESPVSPSATPSSTPSATPALPTATAAQPAATPELTPPPFVSPTARPLATPAPTPRPAPAPVLPVSSPAPAPTLPPSQEPEPSPGESLPQPEPNPELPAEGDAPLITEPSPLPESTPQSPQESPATSGGLGRPVKLALLAGGVALLALALLLGGHGRKRLLSLLLAAGICSAGVQDLLHARMATPPLGDLDGSGSVDQADVLTLARHLVDLEPLDLTVLEQADLNTDGQVDLLDLHLLVLQVLSTATPQTTYDLTQITPTDKKATFQPLLMASSEMAAQGITGAGCQWPVSLASSADGSLMLYGTDVAGLFKSTDHGRTWVRSHAGLVSPGAGMFAIDPHDNDHVVTLGIGDSANVAGIHLSRDGAESWSRTFPINIKGYRYLWAGLAFDPTSYDQDQGQSTDLYFSTPYQRDTQVRLNLNDYRPLSKLTGEEVGLYRSTDGGESFQLFINDPRAADGILCFTTDGTLFLGNQYGLFQVDKTTGALTEHGRFHNDPSTDRNKGVTGLDVVGDTLYIQSWEGIFSWKDGILLKLTDDETYDARWPQHLCVSKTDPKHMLYTYRGYNYEYFSTLVAVTFDGGRTWSTAQADLTSTFFDSVNFASREKILLIDPSQDSNVVTFGGDNVFRSSDGGRNFVQASGISNMMQGGRFHFNYYDPDLLLFSAQDYTGVVSTDGGGTFTDLHMDKGNFYGGFAADENTFFGFANHSWGGGSLTCTHDGGQTWVDTGLTAKYQSSATFYSCLQSPTQPDVLFAQEYRSTDRGYTWTEMEGCSVVYTYSYAGRRQLYGADKDGRLVVSYDSGESWQAVTTAPFDANSVSECIYDMAYDQVNQRLYAVVRTEYDTWGLDRVYSYDIPTGTATQLSVPRDYERGYMRVKSVAVDPRSTSVVYVGMGGDYFSSAVGLVRSIDGGQNWRVLTTSNHPTMEAWTTNQGGYEVACIRVDPRSGRVWLAACCYGHSTMDPPY